MPSVIRGVVLVLSACGPLIGQSERPAHRFEVASVKLTADLRTMPDISTSGARFDARAKSVYPLICYAYNLRSYQVPSTPALMTMENIRYDIAAKTEGPAVPAADEFRLMLQSLLIDRFQLRTHRETHEMAVYALTIGKNGVKLRASPPDANPGRHYATSGHNYVVTIHKATMTDVLDAIENSLIDRPVLDRTGLEGTYDIEMTYSPNLPSRRFATPDSDDITIFTAVEKLGLMLVPQKATVEVLVVDHVEKPSDN
jgi:uncharacterized protein (TIGR03435 family)